MALTLEVTSRTQREALGENVTRSFGREGGTIGRSDDNDWRLPDAERYISSHHATIDFQGGCYYLIDTSTNGVYVNGSDVPVGATKPQRLFDGDTLRMGEYLMSVTIDEHFLMLSDQKDERALIARRDLVQVDDDTDDGSMLDDAQITGAYPLTPRLLSDHAREAVAPRQPRRTPDAGATADKSVRSADNVTVIRPPPAAAETGEGESAVEVFLRALGLEAGELSEMQTRRVMKNAGLALRAFVQGSRELLKNRAAVQSNFRLEQSGHQPHGNNPLKSATGDREAIQELLQGDRTEFASAVESVREACAELRHHDIAIICAMREALDEYTDRFDPAELQQKFDVDTKSGLFGGNRKAQYWQLYCEGYDEMTAHPEGKLPAPFAEEFARAYAEHVERLRRDAERRRIASAPRERNAGASTA